MIRLTPGDRFNRLVFIGMLPGRSAQNWRMGRWRCDCGAETDAPISRVKNGYTKSCGCLVRENGRTHGMKGSPEYRSWQAMLTRCHNQNAKDYPRYGGRGILVCPEWRESFEAFFAHIGPRPDGTTLDRIDGKRGYEPGNVRWATQQQQSENRTFHARH